MTSEVKNNYAYVITQDICNKFIELNFCVGCMVSWQIVYSNIEHPLIINKIPAQWTDGSWAADKIFWQLVDHSFGDLFDDLNSIWEPMGARLGPALTKWT